MKVLVACEESQTVTKAFRKLGFEAYSCDFQPARGGHPEWHVQGCALEQAYSGEYDLMIAHPPCTYMTKASARWMHAGGQINEERFQKAMSAKAFFLKLLSAPIRHIAVENPTPLKVVGLPEHQQIVQPYEYGDPYSKRTLLWIRNLPMLRPTRLVEDFSPYIRSNTGGAKRGQKASKGAPKPGGRTQKQHHSQTFQGIADAMADQWGSFVQKELSSQP